MELKTINKLREWRSNYSAAITVTLLVQDFDDALKEVDTLEARCACLEAALNSSADKVVSIIDKNLILFEALEVAVEALNKNADLEVKHVALSRLAATIARKALARIKEIREPKSSRPEPLRNSSEGVPTIGWKP